MSINVRAIGKRVIKLVQSEHGEISDTLLLVGAVALYLAKHKELLEDINKADVEK